MLKTKYPIFKCLHRGEKGLTLIELLIVIAILGIIAAVIIPNIAGFLVSGRIAAANTELENIKTASLGYYAGVGNNTWPTTSADLVNNGYISGTMKAAYTFDVYGWVDSGNPLIAGGWGDTIEFTDWLSTAEGHSGRWIAAP